MLQPLLKDDRGSNLEALRAANSPSATANKSVRREANLRKISLTRLEKQIQLLQAAGRPLPEEMQVLAGLQRIQYVFVYPDSGDLVLAGPAGDWVVGGDGTVLSRAGGRPPVRLDDLVVVFRQMLGNPEACFGCRITPRQEGLARLQDYLQKKTPPKLGLPGEHKRWSEELRAPAWPAGYRGLRP